MWCVPSHVSGSFESPAKHDDFVEQTFERAAGAPQPASIRTARPRVTPTDITPAPSCGRAVASTVGSAIWA